MKPADQQVEAAVQSQFGQIENTIYVQYPTLIQDNITIVVCKAVLIYAGETIGRG